MSEKRKATSNPEPPNRPRRSAKKVNYAVDLPQLASVPGVKNFYISENLCQGTFKEAGIEVVVTVGDSADLQYKPWKGRADFRFPDGEIDSSAKATGEAAKQHCIAQLGEGKAVAVHCAAGVNRSSLVAVLVMQQLNPAWTPQEAIDKLTKAKLSVNPTWHTHANPHFVPHILEGTSGT